MAQLGQKIVSLLSPSVTDRNGSNTTQSQPQQAAHPPAEHKAQVQSRFASSCELFSMLKALAAGRSEVELAGGEVDSDEDEEGEFVLHPVQEEENDPYDPAVTPTAPKTTQLPHVASTLTVRPDDVSASDSDYPPSRYPGETEEAHKAALDHWMAESLEKTVQERDTLTSRFAALAMSNYSPLSNIEATPAEGSRPHSRLRHKRPSLPSFPSTVRPLSDADETPTDEQEHPELDLAPPIDSSSESSVPYSDDISEYSITPPSSTDGTSAEHDPNRPALGPDIPDNVKLEAIIAEFGPIADSMENIDGTPAEPERILAESKGSLFKGVMLIGNLNLTTHRLLFHAVLPPDEAYRRPFNPNASTEDQANAATVAASHQADVLQAGPVTIHRSALLGNRRVWMELSAEMVTTYPSADEAGRVRPLRSVLLSSVRRLEPYKPDDPCSFFVTYDSPAGLHTTHFVVDTEQSAMQWRRAFEGAIFRHARLQWREIAKSRGLAPESGASDSDEDGWSMMRVCVPLERIRIKGIHDYHSFATLVSLDIDISGNEPHGPPPSVPTGSLAGSDSPGGVASDLRRRLSTLPTSLVRSKGSPKPSRDSSPARRQDSSSNNVASGTATPHAPKWLDTTVPPRLAKATQILQSTPPPGYEPGSEWEHEYSFNVAVLNEQAWFTKALSAAVEGSRVRRYKAGITPPEMILTVGGFNCLANDDELDGPGMLRRSTSMSSEDDPDEEPRGPGHATRKAEKASMAAKMFGLKEERGIWLKRCYVSNGLLPARGHIILTPDYVCFWRKATVGADIKYRFKSRDIKGAEPTAGIRAAFHGMALQIHGHHDLKFEFWSVKARDEVVARIRALSSPMSPIETTGPLKPVVPISTASLAASSTSDASSESQVIESTAPLVESPSATPTPRLPGTSETDAQLKHAADILAPPRDALFSSKAVPEQAMAFMPFIANKPWDKSTVRLTPRTFTCLTIGSRGDVQPYIALCLRLMEDGHKTIIVTHDEFKTWIEGYGIEHRQAGGDPTALMKLSAEHKMFSPGFFKESLGSFRDWLDALLVDSWNACHDADVLIESPSTMSGIHIAEALKIPYFRAFTMPWTRTTAYPQAFMVPAFEMGPSFNYSTYVLFDNILWKATSGQINRWRKKHLGLRSTDMSALSISKVPFLYNFSSAVVPKPLDWHDDINITGYWFLENSDAEWTPPESLERFMAQAKADNKPLVYIGFGSIVVPRPNAMTKSIIKAVEKSGVRAIIAKGWSSRGSDPAKEGEQIVFPDSCYGLDKVPHGWLFPKIQAALHHGGAGTVGASLRAGIPTLIKPWFGDQFFWATRVTKLEVGLKLSSLRSDEIADALVKATTNKVMIEKAARVGEKIRSENGVDNAVNAIHFNIVRAAEDRRKMQWAS